MTKEWYATITDLTPDQRIAWESEDGEYVAGIDSKGSRRAEEEFLSSAGDRVAQDLERFKKFIEEQTNVNNRPGGIRP